MTPPPPVTDPGLPDHPPGRLLSPGLSVGAAAIGGAATGLVLLFLSADHPSLGEPLRTNRALTIAWTLMPWGYLGIQARRVSASPASQHALAALGALTTIATTAIVLGRRQGPAAPGLEMTFVLGPFVQAGVFAVVGLSLWIASRFRR